MKNLVHSLVVASVLGSVVACGSKPSESVGVSDGQALTSDVSASDATTKALGVAKWKVRAEGEAVLIVGVDASRRVVSQLAIRVGPTTESPDMSVVELRWESPRTSERGIVRARQDGRVLETTMPASLTRWAAHAKHDFDARNGTKVQYGCLGDILWAAGGLLGAVATCQPASLVTGVGDLACAGTILGGVVAGTVSAIEDCSWSISCSQLQSCDTICGGPSSQASDCTCYCLNANDGFGPTGWGSDK